MPIIGKQSFRPKNDMADFFTVQDEDRNNVFAVSTDTNGVAVTGTTALTGAVTVTGATTITGAATITGGLTTDVLQAATYGAGAKSTAIAPKTYVRTENGEIVTTLKIDLTGLKSVSDEGDVIGIDGTAKASFLKVLTATHGIVYKGEMSCVELPTASSNVCLDIDIRSEGVDTGAYDTDGSGYTAILAAAGNWALGQTKTFTQGPLADEYLYLITGNTHTGASVYTGGQFIITLYGHAVLA